MYIYVYIYIGAQPPGESTQQGETLKLDPARFRVKGLV
jgi:hypothetical protein